MKIKKKGTHCQECGKFVSYNAKNPAYELCYYCRNTLEDDKIDLYIWHQLIGIERYKYESN